MIATGMVILVVLIVGYILVTYPMNNFSLPPLSQEGKVIIITGASLNGLGFASAQVLSAAGATVVLANRNSETCEVARAALGGGKKTMCLPLDLASFKSVRKFAQAFKSRYGKVDILINNAGVMAVPGEQYTVDGEELTLQTNHYGHFLLTGLLLPIMRKGGRIVNHSSGMGLFPTSFPEGRTKRGKKYFGWAAYIASKKANLLFTFELNERLQESKSPVLRSIRAIAVHPGYTATNLANDRFPKWALPMWLFTHKYLAMSPQQGSIAQTKAASDSEDGIGAVRSRQTMLGPSLLAWGFPVITPTFAVGGSKEQLLALWSDSEKVVNMKVSI